MTGTLAAFGIGPADYAQISADALDDEVLGNTPRMPGPADIAAILTAAQESAAAQEPAATPAAPWGTTSSAPAPSRSPSTS
jgi:hypothetical protein